MLNQKETIIPIGELPEKMPSGLQTLYTFDALAMMVNNSQRQI